MFFYCRGSKASSSNSGSSFRFGLLFVRLFVCGVAYFAPSDSECIFRSFELPLLLFQAMRNGDEPLVEVLLLQQLVRREVIRTIIFAGDGLFGLFIQVALFGRLVDAMFINRRLALLCGWVCMTAVSVEAGLGAALTLPL